MTPREILIAARERISTPERWTKGALARASDGSDMSETLDRAVCWCAIGAIDYEVSGGRSVAAIIATSILTRATGAVGIAATAEWNDAPERTHAEVLAAFDRAIEWAAKEEG